MRIGILPTGYLLSLSALSLTVVEFFVKIYRIGRYQVPLAQILAIASCICPFALVLFLVGLLLYIYTQSGFVYPACIRIDGHDHMYVAVSAAAEREVGWFFLVSMAQEVFSIALSVGE